MKRLFDLTISLPVFLISTPVIFLIACLVRLESKGNPIFKQVRVGKNGRLFKIYKIRSMRLGTPNTATHHSQKADVTKVGQFIRRTKLDELPQLYNVIVGHMSLVGPRPCLPNQTALIEERKKMQVDSLLPGITGISQVRGIDMSDPEYLALSDADYLKQSSLWLDVKLCFATFFSKTRSQQ